MALGVRAAPRDNVESLAAHLDDAALVAAIGRGDRAAAAELFDRFAPTVHRVLGRLLGADRELGDVVHDVFVHAYRDLSKLRDPAAVEGWLVGIAVHSARAHIRRRGARRWLSFLAPEDLPEVAAEGVDPAAQQEVRATYEVLGTLPADLRIAFALRFIDGMKLEEVAEACSVSLATVKRRLRDAETQFRAGARRHPVLTARLDAQAEGPRP